MLFEWFSCGCVFANIKIHVKDTRSTKTMVESGDDEKRVEKDVEKQKKNIGVIS